jgi:raffinose/stachyose/melibiose transport system substrate-binding protein
VDDQTEVTWWLGRGPSPQVFLELFVEPFNASQGDVRLELVVLDSDARNRTVRALEDGAGPDIVMVPRAGDFVTLTRAGYLADLSPYAARFGWLDRLLAPAALLADVDGKLYGLPRSVETMFLLSNRDVLAALEVAPPATLAELEVLAGRALRSGVTPFGGGCADLPESCELLWTLVMNQHAGPDLVKAALRGEVSWTSDVFVDAIEQLASWFDRGWFGADYFTQSIERGLDALTRGTAATAPAMTGMLPADDSRLDATPFPSLRQQVPTPVYIFGTASLIGINAASPVTNAAAQVINALLDPGVRRRFSERVPGDWNIPLAAPSEAGPRSLVTATTGVIDAVGAGRAGWASWSYLPPLSEAIVTDHMRPLMEGRLSASAHLHALDDVLRHERQTGPVPGIA